MKIRSGFVSNSSSSSFLMIGIKMTPEQFKNTEKVLSKMAKNPDLETCYETVERLQLEEKYKRLNLSYDESSGAHMFGIDLSPYDGEINSISLQEAIDIKVRVAEILKEFGLNEEPQILFGTIFG